MRSDTTAHRHSNKDRGHDLYETVEVAVDALLKVEKLPDGPVWEPACGPGAIVRVLRRHGYRVWASDLVDYHTSDQDLVGYDFLDGDINTQFGFGSIVTNPPYKLAEEFVRRAIMLCPRVYMLLRLAFLESERRTAILERCGLARVHVFRKRLPMMHRHQWKGPKSTSTIAFAWFVWDRDHKGPAELHRLSWEE